MVNCLATLVALAVAFSGCSSDSTRDDAAPAAAWVPVESELDHVLDLLPVKDYDDGSSDGAFRGVLTIQDGCAVLEMDDGEAVIHWPFGTELVAPSSVSLAGVTLVDVAEPRSVEMGGGAGEAERGLRLDDAALTECLERTGAPLVLFASEHFRFR